MTRNTNGIEVLSMPVPCDPEGNNTLFLLYWGLQPKGLHMPSITLCKDQLFPCLHKNKAIISIINETKDMK